MNTAMIAKRQGRKDTWSTGVMEYWNNGERGPDPLLPIFPSLQYSITPMLPPSPLSWMKLPVHSLEPGTIDVSIDLRRRDIGVAQHRLDRSQVRASFKQVRGERMTLGMRRDSLINACDQRITAHELPKALSAQRFSRPIDEHKRAGLAFEQSRSDLAHIHR